MPDMRMDQAGAPAGLAVERLCVRLGGARILAGIDLVLQAGEQVAVLGRSGTGKSTLLRAVAGLVLPEAGRVVFGGETWSEGGRLLVPPEARRIGMLAQHPALWPHVTVEGHLLRVLRWRGVAAGERRQEAQAMLGALGLTDLRDRRPAQISGGQAQRVALARALIGGSRLLLLDEPLTHLDPRARRELGELIARQARAAGAAVLHVTHEPREAALHSDRIALLGEGRLLAIGTPAELADEVRATIE